MRCQISDVSKFVEMEPIICEVRVTSVLTKIEITRGRDLYRRKFRVCSFCLERNMPILSAGVKKKGLPDAPHSVTEIVK